MPKFIKFETLKQHKNIVLFKYFSGTAGTHHFIDVDRACIYDLEKQQVLGDVPYQYDSDIQQRIQPTFLVSETLIIVTMPSERGDRNQTRLVIFRSNSYG